MKTSRLLKNLLFISASILFITITIAYGYLLPENLREQLRSRLPKGVFGYIVWSSNRDGDWDIYQMDIPMCRVRKLTQNNVYDINPQISSDGKLIAWEHGADIRRNIWIMNSDGSGQRMVALNASLGSWRHDNKLIIFRDNGNSSFLFDPATGKEIEIQKMENMKYVIPSPDGKFFIGHTIEPPKIWLYDGKLWKYLHDGRDGKFAPDGSFIYWVTKPGEFGRANLKSEIQQSLYKIGKTYYGNGLFPKLSKDMKYLVFSASSLDQSDFNTADYELFLMKMINLSPAWTNPLRITYDPKSDIFPEIFTQIDDTPPEKPSQVRAEFHGQRVKLYWNKSIDAESGVVWYNIYRSQKKNEELITSISSTNYMDYATYPKTKYSYRISAVNSAGLESEKSKAVSMTTIDSEPIAPRNVSVNLVDKKVYVKWDPNPELDIKGYNVYRSLYPKGRYIKLNISLVVKPEYIDTTVEIGKTYYYSITAIDEAGFEGPFSVSAVMSQSS